MPCERNSTRAGAETGTEGASTLGDDGEPDDPAGAAAEIRPAAPAAEPPAGPPTAALPAMAQDTAPAVRADPPLGDAPVPRDPD